MAAPTAIALIPARAGSRRVPGKNVRPLAGHPLMAYAIASAQQSGCFARVVVSTDSKYYADVARYYGAEVPWLRPAAFAADDSPDIEWVEDLLGGLKRRGETYDAFGLLRPTSPFRQAETIQRAWRAFQAAVGIDSLRAVERCRQHPGKMWVLEGGRLRPLLEQPASGTPWHSRPTQSLPEVYVQNASLEIAWSRVVFDTRTITGAVIAPFLTQGYEGFDVNDPDDWIVAERLAAEGRVGLTAIDRPAFAPGHPVSS